jgi:hypothetical protein
MQGRYLARDLYPTVQANAAIRAERAAFDRPVSIISGMGDPYLNDGVIQSFHELFPASHLSLCLKRRDPVQVMKALIVGLLILITDTFSFPLLVRS